jgi:ABC-type transport system substrate-binding protein
MDQINQQPIGTGPFTFVAYQKDAVIRYRRTPTTGGKRRRSTTWSSPSRRTPRFACRS